MTLFLTFRSYGTWLPGDERGSVDRHHNQFGEELAAPNSRLENAARLAMKSSPMICNAAQRECVDKTLRQVAEFRKWTLHVLSVRTNHVHLLVTMPEGLNPDKITTDFKAWATRRLREAALVSEEHRVWEEGGSKRYVFDQAAFDAAYQYIVNQDKEPQA